jgi:hypothetical protein
MTPCTSLIYLLATTLSTNLWCDQIMIWRIKWLMPISHPLSQVLLKSTSKPPLHSNHPQLHLTLDWFCKSACHLGHASKGEVAGYVSFCMWPYAYVSHSTLVLTPPSFVSLSLLDDLPSLVSATVLLLAGSPWSEGERERGRVHGRAMILGRIRCKPPYPLSRFAWPVGYYDQRPACNPTPSSTLSLASPSL